MHSRLAVLDPTSRSDQPFLAPDGSHVLLFNGELFNHVELRAALARRWHFSTTGDTEVLLAGLLLDGASFLDAAQGMYAFALVDRIHGSMLLGRDPLGIKPLFGRFDGTRLTAVASTQRSLMSRSIVSDFNPDAIRQTVLFGASLDHSAASLQVRSMPPGAVWQLRSDGSVASRHQLRGIIANGARSDSFTQDFICSVQRHLVSDVPVGLALSGGLDSSSLLAAAAELGEKPHCFTVAFHDDSASAREVAAASLVASHFGVKHTVVHVGPAEAAEALLRPGLWDEPFAEAAVIPLNRLAAAASSAGVPVLLTGEGSDEYFGGYRRFAAFERIAALPQLPRRGRIGLSWLGSHYGSRLERISDALTAPRHSAARYLWMASSLRPAASCALFGMGQGDLEDSLARWARVEPGSRFGLPEASEFERTVWLPSVYLRKLDIATMAEGVEGRVPFVDVTLLSSASKGVGKQQLREAMKGRLPEAILHRSKQGFGTPTSGWLRSHFAPEIGALMADRRHPIWSVIERQVALRLWEQPMSWRGGDGGLFFALHRWGKWLADSPRLSPK